MLTPAQAETLIGQHLTCLPIESLPLTQAAGAVCCARTSTRSVIIRRSIAWPWMASR